MQKSAVWWMLIVVFVSFSSSFGEVAGKISGKVSDNKTGEALPGANIILKGWDGSKAVDLERPMGASADPQGDYFILNVPVGRYVVTARLVGYKELQYTDVVVNMGRTIQVNFSMAQSVIEGEEMSIIAKREVVQADISSSQIILGSKETQFLPRNTIQEILTLTPGVSISNFDNKIDIRGGGNDQVMAYLDGFSMKDNLFNTPFLSYNRTSIEEISIQTGGFQAEYGELRSGLINIVTKDGGRKYALALDMKYSPPGYRYDGPKLYKEDKAYLIYGSDWSMDENMLAQKFPNQEDRFIGWPKYSEPILSDSDPKNDMTPNQRRQLWLWQHRGRPEGKKPDHIVDLTFSGPFPGAKLPIMGDFFSKLSFMFSHRNDYTAYEHPSFRDHYLERTSMLKVKYHISDNTKLALLGIFSDQWGMGLIPAYQENLSYIMRSGGGGSYIPQANHLVEAKTMNLGMHFEHIVSANTFLEFRISRMGNSYNYHHGPMRDTTKTKQISADYYTIQGDSLRVPGLWNPQTGQYVTGDTMLTHGNTIWCPASFWDEAPNGWVYPGISPLMDQTGKLNLDGTTNNFERSRGSTTLFRFDVTSQVSKIHLIKAGFYYNESVIDRNYYQITSYAENYQKGEGEGEDKAIRFTETPMYGAVYIQDRMELKGLIGNFGLRGEYFDANSKDYQPGDPFSNYFFIPNYWENLNRMSYADSKKYFRVSPRFGISHPMTVNSKIYFNYGHAYSAPDNIYRYGFLTHPYMWSNIYWRGNPNLKPPKTVQYSLGYEHVLFENYLLHTEIYYKDVSDELGVVYYQNVFSDNPTQDYYTWDNKIYQDIIGWEFRINKRLGQFVTGWVQAEFRGQKAGEIGFAKRYMPTDPENISTFSQFSWPDDFLWEWVPSVMINLDLHTPMNWGPKLFGHTVLSGWRLNGIINWSRGTKWTWNPYRSPFIHNNMMNANYFRGDFYIIKDFSVAGVTSSFYIDIRNLLSRTLLNVGALAGPDDIPSKEQYQYYASLQKGDRVGHYKSGHIVHPAEKPGENYYYRVGGPVRVYFGLRLGFN